MESLSTFSEEPISGLRPIVRHITAHREDGQAIVHSSTQGPWQHLNNKSVAFNLLYTTSEFPTQMNDDADLAAHRSVEQAGTGLVNRGGSVCRIVDFSPSNEPVMHRTKSLDYGVVLEGDIELVLDSGETKLMQRGDVAIQRGTMHAWRNPSNTQWARMLFVLLDSHALRADGTVLEEALGTASADILPSNN